MNKAAQSIGRLAAGKPKNYSAAELAKRKKRLADARKKRWPTERVTRRANVKLCGGAPTIQNDT